jgi:hypothetical protein
VERPPVAMLTTLSRALTEGRPEDKVKVYTVPRLLIIDEIGNSHLRRNVGCRGSIREEKAGESAYSARAVQARRVGRSGARRAHLILGDSSNIQAASDVFQTERHSIGEKVRVRRTDIVIEETDFPRVVVRKEGLQKISLVPVPAATQPLFWVLEGLKYVVKMDVDANRETRKNFKEQERQIASALYDVTRINEQQVAVSQRGKQLYRRGFDPCL